jgi:hypothetical protein
MDDWEKPRRLQNNVATLEAWPEFTSAPSSGIRMPIRQEQARNQVRANLVRCDPLRIPFDGARRVDSTGPANSTRGFLPHRRVMMPIQNSAKSSAIRRAFRSRVDKSNGTRGAAGRVTFHRRRKDETAFESARVQTMHARTDLRLRTNKRPAMFKTRKEKSRSGQQFNVTVWSCIRLSLWRKSTCESNRVCKIQN